MLWFLITLRKNRKDYGEAYIVVGIIAGLGLVVLIPTCIGITFDILQCKSSLNMHDRNIAIEQSKYEKAEIIVQKSLSAYPMEEKMYKDLSPNMLLKLPEIKSNTLLQSQISVMINCLEKICCEEKQKSRVMRDLDVYQNWVLVPSLISAQY